MVRTASLFGSLLIAAAGAGASAPQTGMPDIAKRYAMPFDCYGAYDFLMLEGGGTAKREQAFVAAFEAAAAAKKPCPAPPESLRADATDHILNNRDATELVKGWVTAGDPAAMYEVGVAALAGKAVGMTPDDGIALIRKSAEAGDPYAQHVLASFYRTETFGKPDMAAALPWGEKAAAGGNVDAMFLTGVMYQTRQGGRTDKKKAFDYYRQAAQRGHVYAVIMAYNMIQDGEGVKKDFDLGYQIARHIADRGEAIGSILTVSALLQRADAKQNEQEALYWLDKAEREGDATIRAQVATIRPQMQAIYRKIESRRTLASSYAPPSVKACPVKRVCDVSAFSGAELNCRTVTDFWSC